MRILQLCSKVPYPAKDGGCLAMINLAEMMYAKGFDVKILAMETHKHPAPKDGFPKDFTNKFKPESIFIDTKVSRFPAIINLFFSPKSFHLVRFKNQEFEKKLIQILHDYKPDIILLDSLFTCGYIDVLKLNTSAKIIYRAHNVEYVIWQEIAAKTKSFIKKTYLKVQSKRLQTEEMNAIKICDGILAITAKDAQFFNTHFSSIKLMTLPFTVDVSSYKCEKNYQNKSLFYIGAMDWYPNLEGVNWFIDKVWPEVLKHHRDAMFYIAGKAMPKSLKNMEDKNIINMGEVIDAKKFMEIAPVMIAPIFSGGGLKIKIIEAMAMGKIVVCNPQASTGIPVTAKKDVLLANSSKDFIHLINDIFNHLPKHKTIGENARLLIEQHFNSASKATELELFLHAIHSNYTYK